MDRGEIKSLIDKYKQSYNSEWFNQIIDGRDNHYYFESISKWKDSELELMSTELSWEVRSGFNNYIYGLGGSMIKIIDLYKCIHANENYQRLNLKQLSFIKFLKGACDISKSIRLNSLMGDQEIAQEQIEYSVRLYDDFIKIVKNDFRIDIMASPLKYDIVKNRKRFGHPIVPNETKIESSNPHPNIFSDTKGYSIFTNLRAIYDSSSSYRADFSFLYYAMFKDKLIVCRNIEFIQFLSSEYDITIDKIDSRQSGQNKRTPLYESIKNQIL